MKYIAAFLALAVSGMAYGFVLIPTNDVVRICINAEEGCVNTQGNDPVNVVVECAFSGDTNIPLNVNSNPPNNPGDGMVVWIQKNPGEAPIIVDAFHFDSRNFLTFRPSNTTSYFVNDDVISKIGNEPCTCHATDPNAAEGCPVD
jgi:hypothetical protein